MFSSFDFTAPLDDGPLIPPSDQWPLLDSASQGTLPSPAVLAVMPIPPSRGSPRNKNPNHIPRPRNAFMLFRSAFAAAQKISSTIEHDNRHITRIIAHCWNSLSDADKQIWRDKADAEKMQHAKRYPNYRFSPVGRANKPIKRKVRRNGTEDVKRCEKLAELVMEGKFGRELENAIKKIDNERLAAAHVVDDKSDVSTDHIKDSGPSDVAPFRSPLLPPAKISEEDLTAEPLQVDLAEAFYSSAISESGLECLFQSPCHQYYPSDIPNGVPCPKPAPVLDHSSLQPVMRFVQSNHEQLQSIMDFTLFSWNQSDGFSYYS